MKFNSLLARLTGSPRPDRPGSIQDGTAARARANDYFYLGPDLALTRLNDGHFLYVDPVDESVCSHLIARGYWEAWIHRVVCDLVRPGDHVLDIGANVGYYTVAMARRVGEAGFVTAFEANPRLAAMTSRSLTFNGYGKRSRVLQKAAGDAAGTIRFTTSRRNGGGGHIFYADDALGEDTEVVEVETVRLDDLGLENVRFIRIDTEGAEPLILRGAERLLSRPDVVLCMEWDVLQMSSRAEPHEFVAWLTDRGFKFWRITYESELLSVAPEMLPTLDPCDLVIARDNPLP